MPVSFSKIFKEPEEISATPAVPFIPVTTLVNVLVLPVRFFPACNTLYNLPNLRIFPTPESVVTTSMAYSPAFYKALKKRFF